MDWSDVEKVCMEMFHFQTTDEVQKELDTVIGSYFGQHVPKKFKSLEILTSLS